MNQSEFFTTIQRLENSFGKQMSDAQKDLWFEKLKSWSRHKFSKVIELILEDGERFPVLGSVIKLGIQISDAIPPKERQPCDLCNMGGTITAIKNSYKTTLRCPSCGNWEGRYSEKIPIWKSDFIDKGYRIDPDVYLVLDHTDEMQVKGMNLIQSMAPKIFDMIMKKHPQFECVLNQKGKIKEDKQKEEVRNRSLFQDDSRENSF